MKVWLINPYGPLPGEGWRDYRFTMVADALAKRGHEVTWWTAGFDHFSKRTRAVSWETREADGFRVILVPTPTYRRNIGLARVRFETVFSYRVLQRSWSEPAPDLVIAADPPQTSGFAGVVLSNRLRVPLVLDCVDLWPEAYATAIPARLRSIVSLFLEPLFWLRRYNFSKAHGAIAACESYLDVVTAGAAALDRANTATVYLGIDPDQLEGGDEAVLPEKQDGQVWAVYAGSLGENYDIRTVIAAAPLVARQGIHIVIAGDGPLRDVVRDAAVGNLHFLGRLPTTQLPSLYKRSDIGLVPYSASSTVAMPVKAFDYLVAGLPMISSLGRELGALMERESFGLRYVPGDPNSLAEALISLAGDRAGRDDMAANARRVAPRFERTRQYERFVSVVERIGKEWISKSAREETS